jgi:hypothetical protein
MKRIATALYLVLLLLLVGGFPRAVCMQVQKIPETEVLVRHPLFIAPVITGVLKYWRKKSPILQFHSWQEALIMGAQSGNIGLMALALRNGVYINEVSPKARLGFRPRSQALIAALLYNRFPAVQLLVTHNVDLQGIHFEQDSLRSARWACIITSPTSDSQVTKAPFAIYQQFDPRITTLIREVGYWESLSINQAGTLFPELLLHLRILSKNEHDYLYPCLENRTGVRKKMLLAIHEHKSKAKKIMLRQAETGQLTDVLFTYGNQKA